MHRVRAASSIQKQALDAINYDVADAAKKYNTDENKSNAIINCPYFTTNYLLLNGKVAVKKDGSSFTVYICTEGSFKLINGDKEYNFKIGDTVLIPAGMQAFVLEGNAVLLEVYIS
jgi:mannose-6-phosphate isomerase